VTVEGFWELFFSGLAGAALFELFRVLADWRKTGTSPTTIEWVITIVSALVGALVPLLYGTDARTFLEAAQLGVGVPALISGGFAVAAASAAGGGGGGGGGGNNTVNYLGFQFQ
jgi:hypothetical protein